MKNIKYLGLVIGIFAIIISISIVNNISASAMIDGEMGAKIIKIDSPPKKDNKTNKYTCKLTLKFVKLAYEGGHSRNHGACKEMIGTEKTLDLSFEDDKYKDIIKIGNIITVYYFHASGMTRERSYSSEGWEIRGEFVDFTKNKPIIFEENELYGYKDINGKVIIPPMFLNAYNFMDTGIAAVADEHRWYYIDYYGRELVTAYAPECEPDVFVDGLARCIDNRGGSMGFFNEQGEIVIPAKFNYVYPFSEGLAAVCTEYRFKSWNAHKVIQKGKWGYIDKTGNIVIEGKYIRVSPFKNGKATVYTEDHKKIIIDKTGKQVK